MRLVAATPEMVRAELDARDRLAALLGAAVPSDWPPEHHDADTLRFWLEKLSQPGGAGWWLHYAVLTDCAAPTLVGSVGYKGPPNDGVVEIGYAVVPSWQRRGLATEAARALIEAAWQRGAEVVVAHTHEHLEPSIGVLRKLGFERAQPSEPDAIGFRLRRW
jgi:RimJ/RimL family protein N-acetyltransferase